MCSLIAAEVALRKPVWVAFFAEGSIGVGLRIASGLGKFLSACAGMGSSLLSPAPLLLSPAVMSLRERTRPGPSD